VKLTPRAALVFVTAAIVSAIITSYMVNSTDTGDYIRRQVESGLWDGEDRPNLDGGLRWLVG
jgi:hypothetical protein